MSSRRFLFSTASAAVLLVRMGSLASAGDATAPAVSTPNAEVGAFTGAVGGDFTLGSTGSLAIPLSNAWGAQVDGLLGTAGSAAYYGVGGHLFTRDPAKGLLGVTASYVGWAGSHTIAVDTPENGVADVTGGNVGKIGAEAEAYLGRVSIEGAAAYQFGTNSGLAGRATVAFYPTDNLRLDVGYGYLAGSGGSVRGGVEWAPVGNTALFVETATNASASTLLAGVKVYFGAPSKSLIRREREDDPPNLLPDDLYTIVGDGYCPVGTHEINGFCDSNS